MEKGVLKYGEYDGEQSEPIRVDRDRESQTRVKETRRKSRENSGFNIFSLTGIVTRNGLNDLYPERGRELCLAPFDVGLSRALAVLRGLRGKRYYESSLTC